MVSLGLSRLVTILVLLVSTQGLAGAQGFNDTRPLPKVAPSSSSASVADGGHGGSHCYDCPVSTVTVNGGRGCYGCPVSVSTKTEVSTSTCYVTVTRPGDCVKYTTTVFTTKPTIIYTKPTVTTTEKELTTQTDNYTTTSTYLTTSLVTTSVPYAVESNITIFISTTYITTYTETSTSISVSEYNVTQTEIVDHTSYIETTYTEIDTTTNINNLTSYIEKTYTQTNTITEPPVLITLPGEITTTTVDNEASTITLPGEVVTITPEAPPPVTETVTLPPETVTLPGEVTTVIQDGEPITITLPAQTVTLPPVVLPPVTQTEIEIPPPVIITLPAQTVTNEITKTLPGVVTTVLEQGATVTKTLPGEVVTATSTITLPGKVTTLPGKVTTLPAQTVTQTATVTDHPKICPAPTPTFIPTVAPKKEYTWGCAPGYVCNPPKPEGCQIWANPPPVDYVCQPSECLPSPDFTAPTNWGDDYKSNITTYYPPTKGYYNLAPPAFGLSYDIFEEQIITVVKTKGNYTFTKTYTTGNWASQTSLTDGNPLATPPAKRRSFNARKQEQEHHLAEQALRKKGFNLSKKDLEKRDLQTGTVPSMCYNECNNCLVEAQSVGKKPALCEPDSPFESYLEACKACAAAHGDSSKKTLKDYVLPEFQQFLSYCDGSAASSAVESPTAPQSQVGSTASPPVVVTQTQAPVATPAPETTPPAVETTSPAAVQTPTIEPATPATPEPATPATPEPAEPATPVTSEAPSTEATTSTPAETTTSPGEPSSTTTEATNGTPTPSESKTASSSEEFSTSPEATERPRTSNTATATSTGSNSEGNGSGESGVTSGTSSKTSTSASRTTSNAQFTGSPAVAVRPAIWLVFLITGLVILASLLN